MYLIANLLAGMVVLWLLPVLMPLTMGMGKLLTLVMINETYYSTALPAGSNHLTNKR